MTKIHVQYGDRVNIKHMDTHVRNIIHKMFRCSGGKDYLIANDSLRIEMLTDIAELYCDVHRIWNADRNYVASKLWLFTVELTYSEQKELLH